MAGRRPSAAEGPDAGLDTGTAWRGAPNAQADSRSSTMDLWTTMMISLDMESSETVMRCRKEV